MDFTEANTWSAAPTPAATAAEGAAEPMAEGGRSSGDVAVTLRKADAREAAGAVTAWSTGNLDFTVAQNARAAARAPPAAAQPEARAEAQPAARALSGALRNGWP